MTLVTVRGQLEHNTEKRIQLFDGRFDTGYVVKEFWLYPNTGIGAGNDAHGVLYTESGVVANGLSWDWSSISAELRPELCRYQGSDATGPENQ